MAALTQDLIRSLAAFRGREAPVVSLYLDVDGRRYLRPADYEVQLDALLREAAQRTNTHGAGEDDLRRIAGHVKGGLDRSRTRGVAIFSCAAHDLWEVLELPVSVRNQVVVNATPHIRQLETVLDENERFGVLLVDRQRARMFVFELGELVERSELVDQLPRHEDDGGEWDKDHVRDHTQQAAHQHLRRAAQATFEMFQGRPFDHLVIGAPEEVAGALTRELHPYLRDRIAARVNVPVGATDAAIRQAAIEVQAQVERATEAALVQRLRDTVGAGNGGVAGLPEVLSALGQRRVDTLLVSEGYEAPGWRCPACGCMCARGPRCPLCAAAMSQVEDVVEEAMEEALNQRCRVEVVVGSADLDVLGRIGALLRF